MSADNGVYILATKGQYRVKHLQAIDNLYWSDVSKKIEKEIVSTRVVEMFGDCLYTRGAEKATKIAVEILKKLPVCEYGIVFIMVDKTWKQILHEAKELAAIEIKELNSKNDTYSKYKIEELKKVISS